MGASASPGGKPRLLVLWDIDLTLIGDTALDVEAGLTAGIQAIGVATGKASAEELRAAGAHAVAGNLRDCRFLLDQLSGAG